MRFLIKSCFTFLAIVGVYLYLMIDYQRAPATLYTNASFITLEGTISEAMFVDHGLIKAIGSSEELLRYRDQAQEIVDLNGATVLPGFIDSHTHVAMSAFLDGMVDLSGFTHQNNQEVWSHLKAQIANKQAGQWLVAKGLDSILISDLELPDIHFLDKLAPDNPVLILSQSLHTYWANSRAFELVGINKTSADPSTASYYGRNEAGELTGLIVEQLALAPFIEALNQSALSTAVLIDSTSKVFKDYASLGNTTLVSAGLTINDAKALGLYQHLSDRKPRLLNQLLSLFGVLPKRQAHPRHFIYLRHDSSELLPAKPGDNDFYNILGIKHWYDGSPYTGSMFLSEPYLESNLSQQDLHLEPGHRGSALIEGDELENFIRKHHNNGWQIAIHTQGDQAVSEVADVYQSLSEELDIKTRRHRIEHGLLAGAASLAKLQALNMSASYHINHIYYYGDALKQSLIGVERAERILPLASSKQLGLKFSMHADQPMFTSNPLHLIQTAVLRQTKSGQVLGAEQAINVVDAIKAMTIDAAWQIGMEDKLGSLKPGKYADFVVLDQNPLTVSAENLRDIQVLATYVNGNQVH